LDFGLLSSSPFPSASVAETLAMEDSSPLLDGFDFCLHKEKIFKTQANEFITSNENAP
jgi:hypothetical protein